MPTLEWETKPVSFEPVAQLVDTSTEVSHIPQELVRAYTKEQTSKPCVFQNFLSLLCFILF